MDELVAFITARLDEDEAAARESHYEGQHWLTEDEGVYRWPDDELVHMADRKSDARHIARHDPARVLREVAAKRAILAEYEEMTDEGLYHGLEAAIVHLAAVWSDHPDYSAGWKP